jgi:DNA-binding GntR family transcriptional regulator
MEGSLLRNQAARSLQQQVLEGLLRRIGTEFHHGALLPSEAVLCAEYGVSRITIRAALSKLVDQGVLVRKQGVGTFVAGRQRTARSFTLLGFLNEIRAHTYRVVLSEITPAPDEVVEALGIYPKTTVQHLRCVVEREGEALTLADSWTPVGSGHELTDTDLRVGIPSVQAMAFRVGERIERAEQVLEPAALEPELALHLDLPAGTPILRARRTYIATGDRPVQYAVIRYHPTRFRFDVDLLMRGEPGNPVPS